MARETRQVPASRPSRSSRPVVNRERYDEIVQIAGELFAAKGFDGTSLYDIAEAVGVLRGSLYHYITSKEDLLYDVIRVMHERLRENITICERFSGDPLRQLIAFAYNHITLNADARHFSRGAVFWRDVERLSEDKRHMILRDRDAYERHLRKILKAGQTAGVVDPDMDLRMGAFAVLGLVNSHHRWYRPGGPITPRQLGREFTAFVLAAVATPPARDADRYALTDDVIRTLTSGSQ
jgi:AcrR family transcriptional regulator